MISLTRQIIQEVIDKSIKSALVGTNNRIDGLESRLDSRIDGLESRLDKMEKKFDLKFDMVLEQLTDIAGQFKKFETFSLAQA